MTCLGSFLLGRCLCGRCVTVPPAWLPQGLLYVSSRDAVMAEVRWVRELAREEDGVLYVNPFVEVLW